MTIFSWRDFDDDTFHNENLLAFLKSAEKVGCDVVQKHVIEIPGPN